MRPPKKIRPRRFSLGSLFPLLVASQPGLAVEVALGDTTLRTSRLLTYGVAQRIENPDPALIPGVNGHAIGISGTAAGGRNSDDGDLNYRKGSTVSRVLKGYLDIDASQGGFGAFARIKAWRDFALINDAVPWGNSVNTYDVDHALSDRGLPTRSRFSGVVLEDAYLKDRIEVWGHTLEARLGRQTLTWGDPLTIGGGLNSLSPVDMAAARRPGAVLEETRIAVPSLFARFDLTRTTSVEFFQQLGFEPSALPACGSFYSTSDYMVNGCNRIYVGSGSDRSSPYIESTGVSRPHAGGQFGIAFNHRAEPLSTDFGLFAAQYHSRTPFISFIKTTNPGNVPVLPGNPDGNTHFFLEYPESIRMLSLTFSTRIPNTTFAGEVTYRANQPIQLNNGDLRNAFTSTTSLTPLRTSADALAPGAVFHGYDRFNTTHFQVGMTRTVENFLGADIGSLGAETAGKYVAGLPDLSERRYGRKDVFGSGPIAGSCPSGVELCTSAGYVTPWSWGYRLRAQLTYTGLIEGVMLRPTVTYAQDVRGWSADDVFIEGRKTWITSLRAEFRNGIYARLEWQRYAGKAYDIARDRDNIALVIGSKL